MDQYRHHVSGFFPHREDAEGALSRLVDGGLPRDQLKILDAASVPGTTATPAGSNEVLKDVLVDGAIGTAVGSGIGVLAELALVAANVTLFVASPLVAPLAMLGWGASLGGFIGAAAGAGGKDGKFSALIQDAIASGQVVVVAETRTEQETTIAKEVIQALIGQSTDISVA